MPETTGIYVKFKYRSEEFTLSLSNWQQLDSSPLQPSGDGRRDRFKYLNYICSWIYEKVNFIKLIGIYEEQVDNYPFNMNLLIDGVKHGVIYAMNQALLTQLHYALGITEFIRLPKVAKLNFAYYLKLNKKNVALSAAGQLLSLTERDTFIHVELAYHRARFSIYIETQAMQELADTITWNDCYRFSESGSGELKIEAIQLIVSQIAEKINPQFLINKIRPCKLAPLKDYLEVRLKANGKGYTLLLDNWQCLEEPINLTSSNPLTNFQYFAPLYATH